jgi:o-succinylbenzoate synthase
MRVTRIAWAPFRIPFVTPYQTAHGTASHREGFLVRLTTDAGVQGHGEASLDPSSMAPTAPMELLIQSVARLIHQNGDVEAIDGIIEPNLEGDEMARAVHCAFETAWFEIVACAMNIPLAALLSGDPDVPPSPMPARLSVSVNATIAVRGAAEAVQAAKRAVADGFVCIKLKAGMATSIDAEVERVRAVRLAIGSAVRLRLDANGAWDEATAISVLNAVEPFRIELVEQPVPAGDLDALGRVRDAVRVPVAADEAVTNTDSGLTAAMRANVIVLKPMRLGGPAATRSLINAAHGLGTASVVTTTIDTGVATAMALHTIASLPEDRLAHGLATASLLEHDLLKTAIRIEAGTMFLPLGPGLGVRLDEAACARYLGAWREVR